MIRFQCECGRTLQARPDDVGMQAKCPACGLVRAVPGEGEAFTDAAPARDRDDDRRDRDRGRDRDDYRERDDRRDRDDYRDRGRRRRDSEPEQVSGKATAAMALGITSFCLGLLTALPGVILGMLALRDINRSGGRLGGKGAAVAGLVCSGLGLLFSALVGVLMIPGYQRYREAQGRMAESNNLKQVGIALHSHHDVTGTLPAATAYKSRDGKSGLSWRVAILPYIEQDVLYRQFRLDEPWDSPSNIQLLRQMPKTYQQPGRETTDGTTYYQAIVGPNTAFEEDKPFGPPNLPGTNRPGTQLSGFTDGTANTILLAVSDRAVPWTKPDDMTLAPGGALPSFNKTFRGGFNVVMADGSVRFVRADISPETLRAMITRNQGEVISSDW